MVKQAAVWETQTLLAKQQHETVLNELLQARPSEEQLAYQGSPSLKAARVLGEVKLGLKSQTRGSKVEKQLEASVRSDAEAVRLANEQLIKGRMERSAQARIVLEASLGKASESQLEYPEVARKSPASIKALQLLGDQNLELNAKKVVADEPSHKAVKILGPPDLAAPKARKVLGSTEGDGEARALADKHWLEELSRKQGHRKSRVLASRPNEYVRSIPEGCGPVASKALQLFGEEELRSKSLRAFRSRAPPKAVKTMGEAALAGSKAQELTGEQSQDYLHGKRKFSYSSRLSPLSMTSRSPSTRKTRFKAWLDLGHE